MTLALTLALAQGAVYLIIALLTLVQPGPRPRLGRGLAFFSLGAAIWMATQAAWYQGWLPDLWPGLPARLPLYSLLLLASILSAWVGSYLDLNRNAWWLAGVLLLAGLVWLDANPNHLADPLWSNGQQQLLRINFILAALTVGWGVLLGAATWATWRIFRRTTQPSVRNRIKYLAPVLVLLAAGQIIFMARYWNLGGVFHLSGMLLAAYAVLTERLPSLRRAFGRGVSYILTSAIAVIFFTGIFWVVQATYRVSNGLPGWLVAGGLATVMVLLLIPILNRVLEFIHTRVAGASRDPQHLLRQYSQSISNILDIRLLAITVIQLIDETMGAQKGDLFLVDLEKTSAGETLHRIRPAVICRSVMQKESDAADSFSLKEDHPAAVYFREQREPLTRQELRALPGIQSLPTLERDLFNTPNLEIYLPVHSKGKWIGLLGLGPKASGEPYWDDDRFTLRTLADQTAVALENARLVESLMRLNNEFRRAIEALNQANRSLERLDRVKTDFISIASHELLTPLTVLSGYGQMLLEDAQLVENPYYSKIITGLQNGAQRLNEIVDGMLDLAKIDSHALNLDPQPVSLATLIGALVEELRSILDERRQIFQQKNLAGLPAIEADTEALRKVFYHLLMNAIKYTPDGGTLIISGRAIEPLSTEFPRGGVEITIMDTGVGIDPAVQELIFTKFYQTGELALHSSSKSKFKGAGPGLGLAIARGVVEAHGGRVWVESGGYDESALPGSQFHVLLPLYQEHKEVMGLGVNA